MNDRLRTSAPEDLRLLFTGDTSFGENYHARAAQRGDANRLETRGYEPMLDGVSDLLGSADFAVANLETPLTAPGHSPFEGHKRHIHWADPRRTPAVLRRHGVRAVSLGNNHTCDYGTDGLRSTLDALGERGIAAFGAGLHATEAQAPFTRSFGVGDADLGLSVFGGKQRRRSRDADRQPYAGPGPGVHAWRRRRDAVRIHDLRQSDPGRLIVAFPHWGLNYQWCHARQTRLAHALIDAGADLVLGHGSHMMGEIECYRGRWIVYSLGNFVFGSPGRYRKVDGAVPYSLAACIDARRSPHDEVTLSLRLHPLFTDNRVTNYRSRVVSDDEFEVVRRVLGERSPAPEFVRDRWTVGRDAIGPFLETELAALTGLVHARTATRIMHGGPQPIAG